MSTEQTTLGVAADFLSGFAWSASQFKDDGKMPIIRIQNMGGNDNSTFVYWDGAFAPRFVVKKGDMLLSLSGSIKVDIWQGPDALLNQRIVKITARKGISERWLYWQLNHVLAKIEAMGRWALVNNVSVNDLKAFEILLPPLAEQIHIAQVLDQAERLRQQDRQLLAYYDQLVQGVFVEMFGDPVRNEKGWKKQALSEVVKPGKIVTYGIVQAGPHIEDGIPYIKTGDIKNGKITTERLNRTSHEIAHNYRRSAIATGDIVMSIRATVGTVAIVLEELNGANLTQGTARISPGDDVTTEYMYHFLQSPFAQNWIQKQVKGATFREITLSKLRELPVLVPSIEQQQQFVAIAKNIEAQKMATQQLQARFSKPFAAS
jgi:type I restriction enzyme S subunit